MRNARTLPLALLLCVLAAPGDMFARQSASATAVPSAGPAISTDAMEAFLARAKVIRKRSASKGVTGTVRATLSDGTLTHDASIQTVDQSQAVAAMSRGSEINFRDSWKYNVAAYKLARMLSLDMIPVTVARRFDTKDGSFTWWVDDVMMDEADRLKKDTQPPNALRWNEQMFTVRVFDQLIYNVDRNLGNLLIDKSWRIWMIDHSRAFRRQKSLRNPKDLARCDRLMLQKMRELDAATVKRELGDYLIPEEIEGLLARRDLIVTFFDQQGEKALFDRRPAS